MDGGSTVFLRGRGPVILARPHGYPRTVTTSPPTPPDDVTDADWAEQHSSTDPFEEFDATPTVPVRRAAVEADEADVAEQEAIVPLEDDEE